MIAILLLFAVALLLSAFFSGVETGLYRAGRMRLMMDALSGNRVARGLFWLVNNPSVFVATTLVGNNVANYLLSLSSVLIVQRSFGGLHGAVDVVASILFTPIFFIYGELLPKHLFFLVPNRLLHLAGPFILVCTVLFAPISLILWMIARAIQQFVGEAPESVRLRLARSELERALAEGQATGVLTEAQHALIRSVFSSTGATIGEAMIGPFGQRIVTDKDPWATIVARARRQQVSSFVVCDQKTRKFQGYVRVIDVLTARERWRDHLRVLLRFHRDASQFSALMQFYKQRERLAEVVDDYGNTVGLITPALLAGHPAQWE